MTALEEGVLLLCCLLGEKDAHPLTMPQFRELGLRVRAASLPDTPMRELQIDDLLMLGYSREEGGRILSLLQREDSLKRYLHGAAVCGCVPLTRLTPGYPQRVIRHLRFSCPPVLFAKGDISLLDRPSVSLVGSRSLRPKNAAFARTMGLWAAEQGLVLISGGAEGADRTAQEACLSAGGRCIIFVADQLSRHPADPHMLYLSADGYDLPFASYRALSRNRLIHIQGDRVVAAQCTENKGGTWQGCTENLKHKWSELFIYDDGSDGAAALIRQGAWPVLAPWELARPKQEQTRLF